MKKILSMMLCVLLVMSSMATVAFADEAAAPAVIEFGEYLAQLPAGSRIIVNTGDVAEGNTVVATINGVESALVKADGYYAVTVPAGSSDISVAVKDGDTVVAKTATINVFGLSFLDAGTVAQNGTFEVDSTNQIGNKVGYYDYGLNKNWYENVTNLLATVDSTSEADAFVQGRNWGSAAADPNTGDDYTKKASGANVNYTSAQRNFFNVTKFSVDYRFDKTEEINPEDGTVVRTLPMRNAAEIATAMYADSAHGDSASIADCTMLLVQHIFVDTYDSDNDENTTETIRKSFGYWTLNTITGKPQFTQYNDDGSVTFIPVDNFNEGWNTYSVIVDRPNDIVYGYINDIYVGCGHLGSVVLTRPKGHADEGKRVLIASNEALWSGVTGMRIYSSADARAYYSIDNYDIASYTGFASTEPELHVTNDTMDAVHPAGSKTQISALAANIPAGGAIVAVVNGVKVPLTAVNGVYSYNAPLAAGYTSIYVAMVDARGNIVEDSEGNEIKSAEWTYEAIGFNSEVRARFDFNAATEFPSYETYSSASNEEKTAYNALFTGAGFNNGDPIFTAMDYAAYKSAPGATSKVTLEGTTDKYFKITTWGDAFSDPVYTTNPSVARADKSGTIFTSGHRTQDTSTAAVERYIDMSIDYRVEKIETVNATTGALEDTKLVTTPDTLKNWTGAEWNIMDSQYVWDSNYSGKRSTRTLFGYDKSTGKPYALAYNADATEKKVLVDVNPGEWHNYRAIIDLEEDLLYLLVDDVLVNYGYVGVNGDSTDITEVLWPHILSGRQYAGASYNKRMSVNFDNWVMTGYNAADADTSAIVNVAITASGASLGIVPANLDLAEDEAIDIAVIAKTAAGAVEIQKYEDVTSESAYKAFAFDMADIEKVFVWDWATLAPIADVIE